MTRSLWTTAAAAGLAVASSCAPAAPVSRPAAATSSPRTSHVRVVERQARPAPARSTRPPRASRSRRPAPLPPGRGRATLVESSAYCLPGIMANGQRVHHGAAASRLWPLGTRIQHPGGTVTITDRTGPGAWSQLDLWMADCGQARAYGRRTIRVQVIA